MAVKRVVVSQAEEQIIDNSETFEEIPQDANLIPFKTAFNQCYVSKGAFVEFTSQSFYHDSFNIPEELTGCMQSLKAKSVTGIVIEDMDDSPAVLVMIQLDKEFKLFGRNARANSSHFLQAVLDIVLPDYQAVPVTTSQVSQNGGLLAKNHTLGHFLLSSKDDLLLDSEEKGNIHIFEYDARCLRRAPANQYSFHTILGITKLDHMMVLPIQTIETTNEMAEEGITFSGEGYSSSPHFLRCYHQINSENVEAIKKEIYERFPHPVGDKMPLMKALDEGYLQVGEEVFIKGFYENSNKMLFTDGVHLDGMKDMIKFGDSENYAVIDNTKTDDGVKLKIRYWLSARVSKMDKSILTDLLSLREKGIDDISVHCIKEAVDIVIPLSNLSVEFISYKQAGNFMEENFGITKLPLWANSVEEIPMVSILENHLFQKE